MSQIDLFEIMFKIIVNYTDIITIKTLILQLSMKCLPIYSESELYYKLALKTLIFQLKMKSLPV